MTDSKSPKVLDWEQAYREEGDFDGPIVVILARCQGGGDQDQ